MSWDGEKTLTFTMEDALISTDSLALLAAAKGKTSENTIIHTQKRLGVGTGTSPDKSYVTISNTDNTITLNSEDALENVKDDLVYVLVADEGGFASEPYLYTISENGTTLTKATADSYNGGNEYEINSLADLKAAKAIYLDYYTEGNSTTTLTIEPDTFGNNFYVEADTLFRDENGVDYAAIFTIPKCRVQSNFSITMASSGDPSEKVMRLAA